MDSSEGKPPTTLERQNMTTYTDLQKAAIKKEAKDLGINIVAKTIGRLLDLIDEKTGRTRELTLKVINGEEITEDDENTLLPEAKPVARSLTLPQLKEICKTLGIANSKTTPRADLMHAIAKAKGWDEEKPEVIEFLLAGGEISEVPGFTGIAPKVNNRETSAGGKVQPQEPKAPRKPRKVNKPKEERGALRADLVIEGTLVTLQVICEELGVEGRVARRKLRGSDIQKPGDSWTWNADHQDVQLVRDLLTK